MSLSSHLFPTLGESELERLMESRSERDPITPKKTRAKKGKAARALGHRLSNKLIEHYQALGYMAFRVDYTQVIYGGALQTMDLLGIGDVLAIGHGECILAQSTVAEGRTAHERKLCEDRKALPRFGLSVYALALRWLHHGGRIELVSFEKSERGKWEPEVFNVTLPWLIERHDALNVRRAKDGKNTHD